MARPTHQYAARELAGRDRVLGRLVDLAGPPRLRPRDPDGRFGALVRAIVYQQLAGKAAAAIHGRARALVRGPITPTAIEKVPDAALREAGLSASKLASIRDLSARSLDGTIPLDRLARFSDDEVVARLSEVRGIGRWTAEMFLLFELRRLDVWPTGDLGVRAGYGLAWGLDEAPTARVLEPLGDPYRPFRSVVAWYCWEAVHLHRAGIDIGASAG